MRYVLAAVLVAAAVPAAAVQMTVYKEKDFRGESRVFQDGTHDLARMNFHDQISSLVVESGAWEFCTQPGFSGDCVVLTPGRYATLPSKLNHRIESVREAPPYILSATTKAAVGIGDGPALVLFSGERFMGASHGVRKDTRVLLETGFSAPAASLVVHEGKWQACSEAGYQGTCRVFGPGRYRDLSTYGVSIVSLRRLPGDE